MNIYKIISTILHPIVVPTIGMFLYFVFVPHLFTRDQQLIMLSMVFLATYVFPLLMLVVLKGLSSINSFHLETIEERKIPLFIMTILFYFLVKFLLFLSVQTKDIALLFYGIAISLVIVYVLFYAKLKSSLHMASLGGAIGFFLALTVQYGTTFLPIIAILILLAGLLGTARLSLKAHTVAEVYIGFFVGVLGQIVAFALL